MPEPVKPEGKNRDMIVVDLGSKSRKQVKRLRKGKGKLMDKVNECITELKSSGTITGVVQPVVIVVKEKASMPSFMGMFG
jgi:uncharacterized protein (UPF0335 family)